MVLRPAELSASVELLGQNMNATDIVIANGTRISELRRSCGLTQQELAKATGYAIRTIGKAEQSQNVRFSSLIAIATALQRNGETVSALDLCTNPLQVAQQFVEAYRLHEENMVDRVRHLLSDKLEVFIAGCVLDGEQDALLHFLGAGAGIRHRDHDLLRRAGYLADAAGAAARRLGRHRH